MKTIYALVAGIACTLSGVAFAGPVNVNTATAQQLDSELHGVGPTIAQRIVEFRESNGRFASPSDLLQVKGVGQKTLARNDSNILLD